MALYLNAIKLELEENIEALNSYRDAFSINIYSFQTNEN